MSDNERPVIDRWEIKKEMYKEMEAVASKYNLTSVELIGVIEEIKSGILIDASIQAWNKEQTVQ